MSKENADAPVPHRETGVAGKTWHGHGQLPRIWGWCSGLPGLPGSRLGRVPPVGCFQCRTRADPLLQPRPCAQPWNEMPLGACLDALGIEAEGCVSRSCFLVRTGAAGCCARLIVSCRTTSPDVRASPQVRRRAGQSWFASASGACMESRLLPRRRRSRLLDRWVRMAARAASASWLLMAL